MLEAEFTSLLEKHEITSLLTPILLHCQMVRMPLQLVRGASSTSQSCSNSIAQPSMPITSSSLTLEYCRFVVILFRLGLGFLAFRILVSHVATYVALYWHLESSLQKYQCRPLRTPEKQFLLPRCHHEGRSTFRNNYHVERAAVRILIKLLLLATILLSRTRDRSARNQTFGRSGGTKIQFLPNPL